MRLDAFRLFCALAIAAIITLASPSRAQVRRPLRNGVFMTRVAHMDLARGGHPVGTGGAEAAPSPETLSPEFMASFPLVLSPYLVSLTITPTSTSPEAEEYIAADPNNSANLLAAISDFNPAPLGGFNITKYAFSSNGGTSWTQRYVPFNASTHLLLTGDSRQWQANSDPVVANDTAGNVYLSDLYFNVGNNAGGLYVATTRRGSSGVNFSLSNIRPVVVNTAPTTGIFEDKDWITVDNSSTATKGTIYVSWTRFTAYTDFILLSRSTNFGRNWSGRIQISSPSQNGNVQGSQVAVGPDGTVYVAYEVYFSNNKRQHFLAISTDGGASFSTPVPITPMFNGLTFNSIYRIDSFISLAVGPEGNIYGVYADQPSSSSEVEFIVSTDGGATFSLPKIINDVLTGQRLMPAVAVNGLGVVHTSWFDTRNSSSTSQYDIYATYSKDLGVTFAPNARVTKSLVRASNFIGDYAGIAAAVTPSSSSVAHPVWTRGLLQTATLTVP